MSNKDVPPALLARWKDSGLHAGLTLAAAFAEGAVRNPTARLLIHSATRPDDIILAELHQRGLGLAGALAHCGARAGDIIALQTPNSLEGILMIRAAAALGCVILPIVHIYGPAEVAYILRESRARFLVVPDRWRNIDFVERLERIGSIPTLERIIIIGEKGPPGAILWREFSALSDPSFPPARHGAEDAALLLYTSGTTAAPKGVLHSANGLVAEIRNMGRSTQMTLSAWPSGHIAGLIKVLQHAISGTPLVLMEAWDAAQAAALVAHHRVHASSGTPFHLASLLDAAELGEHDISSLHDYSAGGAPVPSAVVQRCSELGLATYRSYGSSEHPTVTSGSVSDPLLRRLSTEGKVSGGNEMRIVNDNGDNVEPGCEGEIVTRGPERFLGYHDAALDIDAFLPGGWFRSGDIGRVDDEGFLFITDRKKDIVNRGGEKISSLEVEHCLLKLSGVADVAVVAMPHARLGECVAAFIVAAPGAAPTLAAIGAHFAALGVARQKTPEHLVLVSELPRTVSGKVQKQQLRAGLLASR